MSIERNDMDRDQIDLVLAIGDSGVLPTWSYVPRIQQPDAFPDPTSRTNQVFSPDLIQSLVNKQLLVPDMPLAAVEGGVPYNHGRFLITDEGRLFYKIFSAFRSYNAIK
jgi:hypothetical protein